MAGLLEYKPKYAGKYTPRITHVPKDTVHLIMGAATHKAWEILVRERIDAALAGSPMAGHIPRVPAGELHKLAGKLAKQAHAEFLDKLVPKA